MTAAEAATVEEVTDEQVRQAEQEADEAHSLVDAIQRRAADGQDPQPGELTSARELAEFARLRVEATGKRRDRARAAARLRDLDTIRREIAAHTCTIGSDAAAKLREAEQALTAAVALFADHNTRVSDWYTRAQALDAPQTLNGFGLDETSATVGLPPRSTAAVVFAAGRQHTHIDPRGYVGRMLARVRVNYAATALSLDASAYGVLPDRVYDDLARLDTPKEPR